MKKILLIFSIFIIFNCISAENAIQENDEKNIENKEESTIENNCISLKEGIEKANCLIDNAYYLAEFEKNQIREMNKARVDPQDYLNDTVLVYEKHIKEYYIQFSNGAELISSFQPYIDALKERLQNTEALDPLYPSVGLTVTVRDFIQDTGRKTHESSTEEMNYLVDRLKLYGSFSGAIGEIAWDNNLDLDTKKVNESDFVLAWLIDLNNAPNYGHREAILNPDFKYIGIAGGIAKNKKKGSFYANLAYEYEDNQEIKNDLNYINPVVTWEVNHKPYTY